VAEPLRFFDLEKDVIALSFQGEHEKKGINGACIHWIRWNPIVEKVLAQSSVEGGLPTLLKRYPWFFLFLPMIIWKMLKTTKALLKKHSIIHVHWLPNALPALILRKIYGTPFIVTVRGSEQAYINSRLFRSIVKNIINYSEYIISVSARLRKEMINTYGNNNKILYIPNGVNHVSAVNNEAFNDNELKMIFVGNLTLNKAVHVLLRSLTNLKIKAGFHLSIIGEGPERDNLQLLTRSYGLNGKVEFKGNIDHQEVFRVIQTNCVLVLPSFSEGTPNVIKEAMVCARPVIATNVGGTPELIEHGVNGLLFEPGDHKTLSDHITYLAENREVVREMGLKGRQFIIDQDLTWENTAKQYMKIYKNILEQQ
jgi:glycosyltransferase involved in cell wall biosynthesis